MRASEHFGTIPYEPYTVQKIQEKTFLLFNICHFANEIVYARLEILQFFKGFCALRTIGKCTSRHLFVPQRIKDNVKFVLPTGRAITKVFAPIISPLNMTASK